MMISDNERREVARRLRAAKRPSLMVLMDVLGVGGEGVFARLAGLIEPGEPKVRCVAEVKVDGEQLDELVHDATVELTGIDREALLALAREMKFKAKESEAYFAGIHPGEVVEYARRIREALGVSE